jgi:hypothetical protein
MSTREKLIESGLFIETTSRDLAFLHPEDETTNIKVTFEFDPFGDLQHVSAALVNKAMAEMVANNRKALGLPPQHSAEVGHL